MSKSVFFSDSRRTWSIISAPILRSTLELQSLAVSAIQFQTFSQFSSMFFSLPSETEICFWTFNKLFSNFFIFTLKSGKIAKFESWFIFIPSSMTSLYICL